MTPTPTPCHLWANVSWWLGSSRTSGLRTASSGTLISPPHGKCPQELSVVCFEPRPQAVSDM